MNKRQKEVIEHQLTMEKAVLDALEKEYRAALKDINLKIKMLQSDELTQSKIYHIQYQKTLKKQVEAAIEKLHSDEYSTIQQYLSESYTDAFVGTMYDVHGQGVPVIAPIDQNAAIKAVLTDSKLSKPLYDSLGVDVNKLKKNISQEISRGIASGLLYDEIARNIQFHTNAPLSRAKTIVRTDGHRIREASAEDARQIAKSKGADVVGQWDSILDGDTRPTHRELDGQIRELNEYFEVAGKKARHPGDFGDPAEDCNCRCTKLTRARWALDEDELETLKERAKFFDLDKSADFDDFKKKYLKAAEKISINEHKPISAELETKRKAAIEHFKNLGADVDVYGNVTLYHATAEENVPKINKVGFKPTNAPINGVTAEEIKERVFFSHDKAWVADTWAANGQYKIMEVKIPAEYLHQAGNNTLEVFVEGTIKNNNGLWIPDTEPTSTAWDRKLVKRWQKKIEKATETIAETPEINFVPAKTIEEAEGYAQRFVEKYKSKYTGNVSYKGLDLEYANALNKTMTEVFDKYETKYPIRNINAFNFREKRFKDATAEAAYQWGVGDLFYNPKYFKSPKAFAAYQKQVNELMEQCLGFVDEALAKKDLKPEKRKFWEALKASGVQCFSQRTDDHVGGTFVHELGHYLDDNLFMKAFKEKGIDVIASKERYGTKISAYATTTRHEYIAEAFSAFWYGREDLVDPDLVAVFKETMKK